MRAVIIGNGIINDYDYIGKKIRKSDYVICADGGYRHAQALGIRPEVVIGDMDSLGQSDYDGEVINLPVRKDFTDSEVCVKYILLKDFDEILMLGFTGTRADHTMNNIFLLKQIYDAGKKGRIVDEHNEIVFAERENTIYGEKGDIVSIIPVGQNMCGITTNGLDYPLNNETLIFGESRGISNVMISGKCTINVASGVGVIIRTRD